MSEIRIGQTVYVPYLAWGREPRMEELRVKRAGPKLVTTSNGRWAHDRVYTNKAEAIAKLCELLEGKLADLRSDVTKYETALANAKGKLAEIGGMP